MFQAEAQYLTMIMISGKVPGVLCPHVLEALSAGEEEIRSVKSIKNTNFMFRTGFGGGIMWWLLSARSLPSEPAWCQCY